MRAPGVAAGIALEVAVGLWLVRRWSARSGWGARHRLAVAMGVLGFFLVPWDPILEYVLRQPKEIGVTEASALIFVTLFILDWRLKRRAMSPAAEAL